MLSAPTSSGASCTGGAGESSPSRPATHSSVVPCTVTDTTTTKKTALKIVFEWVTSEESTNVASTIGTAPRSPAQPSSARSLFVNLLKSVEAQTAAGRDQEHQHERQREARERHVAQLAREDQQPEDDEDRDLREEGEPFVEGDELASVARRRAADREPDEVDREEAAAADHVGGAERERAGGHRRHRREAADRVGEPPEDPDRDRAERDADEQSEADLLDDQEREVVEAVRVRTLDPGDQARASARCRSGRSRPTPPRACEPACAGCASSASLRRPLPRRWRRRRRRAGTTRARSGRRASTPRRR